MNRWFTDRELIHYRKRGRQSIAGAIALKKALVKLTASLDPKISTITRNYELSHKKNGMPVIKTFPESVDEKLQTRIHFSITHTRETAFALVVLQC